MTALSAKSLKLLIEALSTAALSDEQRAAADELRNLTLPRSRFSKRDALLREVRRRFFSHRNDSEASNEIAIGLRRYEGSAWRARDRDESECPPRIAGTVQGAYWQILKLVPKTLSADRIRTIIAQKSADEMSNDRRDGEFD